MFSSVQFDRLFTYTCLCSPGRFSEVVGPLEELGFQSTPKLSFGDGGRAQTVYKRTQCINSSIWWNGLYL